MHLWWEPAPAPATAVSAVLEVMVPPAVPHLHFWALQVSFVDRGRRVGGGHLGLQWYDRHPGGTAVNWGGYGEGGGELDGDEPSLPSATGNHNTRDFAWRPRTPYRLSISGDGDGWWAGAVTDLTTDETTIVRRLRGGGTHLADPVVWSEVFAPCDAPSTTIRWSRLEPAPRTLRPTHQSFADGGCTNARSIPDGQDGWLQVTNAHT